jgi:hypothetical protein
MQSRRGRRILLAGLIGYAAGMYALMALPESTYNSLIDDDRWVEGAGTLALLAASAFFLFGFVRVRRLPPARRPPRLLQVSLVALAILFFTGFGEELSWGQRILGIETPSDIEEASSQGELNFHNLEALGSDYLDADRLFQLFWFSFGVLVPLGAALFLVLRRLLRRVVPIMPLVISAALVANQLLDWAAHEYFESRYHSEGFPLSHSLFETKESVTSLILAIGAWYVFDRLRTGSADALHLDEGDSLLRRSTSARGRGERRVEQPTAGG